MPDLIGDDLDTDCSGGDGQDEDRDGYPIGGPEADCADLDATRHPGAPDNQGWTIEDVAISGNLGSLVLVGSGVPVVSGGPSPGCQIDTDGDGLADTPVVPGGTAVQIVRKRGAGWQLSSDREACVLSRLEMSGSSSGVASWVAAGNERHDPELSGLLFGTAFLEGLTSQGFDRSEVLTPAIALGPCDEVFVLHRDRDDRLVLARNKDTNWQREVVDDRPGRLNKIAVGSSLAVDAVYIAEEDSTSETILLLRGLPEVTSTTTIWGPAFAGEVVDVALAVDDEGGDRVALLARDGVWVITSAGEGVEAEPVDMTPINPDEDQSSTIAIAVDGNGFAHLAWVVPAESPDHGQIRYATNRAGFWQLETVDRGDGWADLVVDSSRNPHLCWHTDRRGDETGDHFGRYASWTGVDGIDQNCDGVDGIDADGDGHASRETGGDDPDDSVPIP